MNAVSYYQKHPAMQYVWLQACVTTPIMQTHHSVKTPGLPNQHLAHQRKRFIQPRRKAAKTPLLDVQKPQNNSKKHLTQEEILVPICTGLIWFRHSSVLTDMFRQNSLIFAFFELSMLHPTVENRWSWSRYEDVHEAAQTQRKEGSFMTLLWCFIAGRPHVWLTLLQSRSALFCV